MTSKTNQVQIKVESNIVSLKIEATSPEQAKEFAEVLQAALLDMLKPRIDWLK